ncbi:MAG: DUF192 domain-containing protein [Paracoccaceae bacterium]
MALSLCCLAGSVAAQCRPDVVDIRWPGGKARFQVELAETPEAQQRGLMFRAELAPSAGMLFVFPEAKHASFWMKDTLIPLDMLFADASGRITRIHPDAIPHDETPIDGGGGVKFVLEINGGLAARLHMPEGAEMRSPVIEPRTAAWACD